MATTRNLQIDFHLEEFIDTTVPLISSSYKQSIYILAQKTLTEWTYYPAFMKSRSRFSGSLALIKKIYNLFKLSAVYIPEQT